MQNGRHPVLWLTLCWVLAAVLITDLLWFVRGGASEVNDGRVGVLIPAVAAGPVFTDPPAVLSPDDDSAEPPTEAGLTAALTSLLTDRRLGTSVAVSVRDAENGTTLFSRNADTPVTPASTTKTVTAAGVLLAYGPPELQARVLARPLERRTCSRTPESGHPRRMMLPAGRAASLPGADLAGGAAGGTVGRGTVARGDPECGRCAVR